MNKISNNKLIYTALMCLLFIINSVYAVTISYVEVESGKTVTVDHINERVDRIMEKIGEGELIVNSASTPPSGQEEIDVTKGNAAAFVTKISGGTISINDADALGDNIVLSGGTWRLPSSSPADMSTKKLDIYTNSTVDVRTTGHTLPIIGNSSSTLTLLHSGGSAAEVNLSSITGLGMLAIGQSWQQSLTARGNFSNVKSLLLKTNGKAKVANGECCTGTVSLDGGELNTTNSSTISNELNISENNGSITADDALTINGIVSFSNSSGSLDISAPSKKVILNQAANSAMSGSLKILQGELKIASSFGFGSTTKLSISSEAKATFSVNSTLNELSFF